MLYIVLESCLKEMVDSGEAFDACFIFIFVSPWSLLLLLLDASFSRKGTEIIHDAAMRNRQTATALWALNYLSRQVILRRVLIVLVLSFSRPLLPRFFGSRRPLTD